MPGAAAPGADTTMCSCLWGWEASRLGAQRRKRLDGKEAQPYT